MRNLRSDHRGVAGFFEEIPAAAVAIVVLLLFFSALLAGLSNFGTTQQTTNFSAQAETFLEGLLGYSNLTYQDQAGVFDVYSMLALSVQNLTYNFHPQFQYNITITDISMYGHHYNKVIGTASFPPNPNGLTNGWVRDSTSVDIWVPTYAFDEYHAAILTVEIWS